jgi:hypothetical protein
VKKADPPLSVQIPTQTADQPSWLRVGVVAVIGFAVGVAWPRLAGIKLGPSAPTTATQEQAAPGASSAPALAKAPSTPPPTTIGRPEPSPTASLVAPVASSTAAVGSDAPSQGNAATGPTVVSVKPGIVIGCRTEAGEKLPGKQCGTTSFDTLALPRLKKLASCPAAAGAEGRLSPQFHLDFVNSKLIVQMGHKNTVDNVDSFSACLGTLFEKVSINAVTHEHQRYSIQYNITFGKGEAGAKPTAAGGASPGSAASGGAAAGSGDAGEAKIAYDVAIVRDAPRTGQIVGRIQQGTTVQVLATDNSWYKVRANGTEGWVYRGAIGR